MCPVVRLILNQLEGAIKMRRVKLQVTEASEIDHLLADSEWGTLGIARKDAAPCLVPLNFVSIRNRIFFHGALAGEKMALAKESPDVSFVVVQAYSQLPSYFFDERAACPATQLYKSAIFFGKLRLVNDDVEKAAALQALMEKLQPEGKYEPITADSDLYRNRLKGVAVIALDIEKVSAKFKLGQDQTSEWRGEVSDKLARRGCPVDYSTICEIGRFSNTAGCAQPIQTLAASGSETREA